MRIGRYFGAVFIAALALLLLAQDSATKKTPVTFNRDVAPIVFNNCLQCHRAGEVAPFPLTSYEEVKKRGKTIVSATSKHRMPPWKADEPAPEEFHGARRLTDEQIATIKQWYDDGMPEGDAKDLPAVPKFADGWFLGEPDMVVKMPEEFTIHAEGPDIYRCFVIPTSFEEDKYVTAVEFRPGNKRVTHHCLVYLDSSGKARKLDEGEKGPGYSTGGGVGFRPSGELGGWAPGAFPVPLPDGVAKPLAKGSDIVLQIHYHPNGKDENDLSQLGIYFSKEKPKKLLTTIMLLYHDLDIPAGEKSYRVEKTFHLPLDMDLIGAIPHAHLLCREIKCTATFPDKTTKTLIWIKDWDFNWQEHYRYKNPVRLPKGTDVKMEFAYDNSADNWANPNKPPRRVTWGEQTTDEMAIIFAQLLPVESGGDEKKWKMLKKFASGD